MAGLLIGTMILVGGNPLLGLVEFADQLVAVFSDPGNTRVVFFCLLVGGLIALVQASGGVQGFIGWAQRRGWGTTRRGAELLAWGVGMVIFVESSITSLTVGAVSRPFFDTLRLPREKLAYYCDATSAPVCISLPLNGWGAFILGLLAAQGMVEGAVALLINSLLFNFFAIGAILLALVLAVTGWGFGPMRSAEKRAAETGAVTRVGSRPMISEEVADIRPVEHSNHQMKDLVVPILLMVFMIFLGLFVTGNGNMMAGSGSTSVLWAVGTAVLGAMILYAVPRKSLGGRSLLTPADSIDWVLKGSAGLVGVTFLIVLAFALGQVSRELDMGTYVVGLIGTGGPTWWIPAAVFTIGCFVSFTLGSSWTAFAILIPIALPLAQGLDVSAPLMLGAVLSGGVFGDHASPLSDTSIISSMSAACDHIDHVNSQMPYALMLAAGSFICFLFAGALV